MQPISFNDITLKALYVHSSNLYGELPSTLTLPSLISITLFNNKLSHFLPPNLMNINHAFVAFNNTKQNVIILLGNRFMSYHHLPGYIPDDFKKENLHITPQQEESSLILVVTSGIFIVLIVFFPNMSMSHNYESTSIFQSIKICNCLF